MANAFVTIGTNGFHLTELVPAGYGSQCKGTIYIEVLDKSGMADATYRWYDNAGGRYPDTGWYKGQTLIVKGDENDRFFEYGEGLWVTGIEGGVLPFSGEVKLANIDIPLIAGSKMVANPYPTTLKLLRDIKPIGYGSQCKGAIYIEVLDKSGMADATYRWYDNAGGRYPNTGWYKGQDLITTETDITIAGSGEGMWVTGIDGAAIRITCPISTDK